jgi:hypothetical protein
MTQPEADLSTHVLHLLDQHLAAIEGIRSRMMVRAASVPGGRHALALDGVRAAREFASELSQALVVP